jgi:coproporphyrinogen III oxidase
MITKETIAAELQALQSRICNAIESADGSGKFVVEEWSREGGGGGITRILQNGNVLEKAGVNFSAVHGELPQNIMNALNVSSSQFFACGVSIVMHPVSPMVPIIHMNVRYFELGDGQWWFGGGIDLTPHYVNESDAKFFHQELKQVCDRYDSGFYPKFKKWADDYFFIKHRNETRGIGGRKHFSLFCSTSEILSHRFIQSSFIGIANCISVKMKSNGNYCAADDM